jgi:hypothetical protein
VDDGASWSDFRCQRPLAHPEPVSLRPDCLVVLVQDLCADPNRLFCRDVYVTLDGISHRRDG